MTRDLMSRMPSGLEMVADLSHWINVAETNSDDPDLVKVIEDLAPKFRHTHARVGYDHGPQVPGKFTANKGRISIVKLSIL